MVFCLLYFTVELLEEWSSLLVFSSTLPTTTHLSTLGNLAFPSLASMMPWGLPHSQLHRLSCLVWPPRSPGLPVDMSFPLTLSPHSPLAPLFLPRMFLVSLRYLIKLTSPSPWPSAAAFLAPSLLRRAQLTAQQSMALLRLDVTCEP